MCEETEVNYLDGDVVWVKLGSCWWPGEVVDKEKLPTGVLPSFRKPPIAVVKFFEETTYEYVKNVSNIEKYNCTRKNEFIIKGLHMYRTKHGLMEKFPEDVIRAETKVGGDIEILTRDEYQEKKKETVDYAGIFGSSSAKKTPTSGKKGKGKGQQSTENATPTNKFLREKTDYKVHILIQPSKETPTKQNPDESREGEKEKDGASTPSTSRAGSEVVDDKPKTSPTTVSTPTSNSGTYSCPNCSFTTVRLNVLILHYKTHSGNYMPYTPSPVRKKPTSKSPNKSTPKTIKTPRPRKEKSNKETAPKKQSKSKKRAAEEKPELEVKKPKTDEEIKSSLLADWDDDLDDDSTDETSLLITRSPELPVGSESPAAPTSAELPSEKSTKSCEPLSSIPLPSSPEKKTSDSSIEKPESSDSKYEFCEDEDWPVEADGGRKIPRVKNPSKRKGDAKSISLDEVDVVKEVAELLNNTAVPELPSVPAPLKVETNFPEPSIVKSPDKKVENNALEPNKSTVSPTLEPKPTKTIFKTKTFFRSRHSRSQDAIGKYIAEQLNPDRIELADNDLNGSEAVSSPEARESPPIDHMKVARLAPKIQLKKMKAEAALLEKERNRLEALEESKANIEPEFENIGYTLSTKTTQDVIYPTQEIKPINKETPEKIHHRELIKDPLNKIRNQMKLSNELLNVFQTDSVSNVAKNNLSNKIVENELLKTPVTEKTYVVETPSVSIIAKQSEMQQDKFIYEQVAQDLNKFSMDYIPKKLIRNKKEKVENISLLNTALEKHVESSLILETTSGPMEVDTSVNTSKEKSSTTLAKHRTEVLTSPKKGSMSPVKTSTNLQKTYEQLMQPYMNESTASAVDALLSVSREADRVSRIISSGPPEDLFEDDKTETINDEPINFSSVDNSNSEKHLTEQDQVGDIVRDQVPNGVREESTHETSEQHLQNTPILQNITETMVESKPAEHQVDNRQDAPIIDNLVSGYDFQIAETQIESKSVEHQGDYRQDAPVSHQGDDRQDAPVIENSPSGYDFQIAETQIESKPVEHEMDDRQNAPGIENSLSGYDFQIAKTHIESKAGEHQVDDRQGTPVIESLPSGYDEQITETPIESKPVEHQGGDRQDAPVIDNSPSGYDYQKTETHIESNPVEHQGGDRQNAPVIDNSPSGYDYQKTETHIESNPVEHQGDDKQDGPVIENSHSGYGFEIAETQIKSKLIEQVDDRQDTPVVHNSPSVYEYQVPETQFESKQAEHQGDDRQDDDVIENSPLGYDFEISETHIKSKPVEHKMDDRQDTPVVENSPSGYDFQIAETEVESGPLNHQVDDRQDKPAIDNLPSEYDLQIAETLLNLPATAIQNKPTETRETVVIPMSVDDHRYPETIPVNEMTVENNKICNNNSNDSDIVPELLLANNKNLNIRYETEQEKSENLNAAQSLVQMSESIDHKINSIDSVQVSNKEIVEPKFNNKQKNGPDSGTTVEQKMESLLSENNSDATNGMNRRPKFETTSRLLKILEEPTTPKPPLVNKTKQAPPMRQLLVTGKEKILNFDVAKSSKSKPMPSKQKIIIRRAGSSGTKTIINSLNNLSDVVASPDKIILSRTSKPGQDGSAVQTFTIQAPPESTTTSDTKQIIIQPAVKKITKPKVQNIKPQNSLVNWSETPKTSAETSVSDDAIFDINSMPVVLSEDILTAESIDKMPIVMSDGNLITSTSLTTQQEPNAPSEVIRTTKPMIMETEKIVMTPKVTQYEKVAINPSPSKPEVKKLFTNPVSEVNKVTTPNILSKSSKLRGAKPMLVIDKATGKQKIIMTKAEPVLKELKPATQTKVQAAPLTKIQAAPQTKIQAAPQTKVQSAPLTKIQAAPQTKIQAAPQTKVQSAPQTKVQSTLQTKVQSAPQTIVQAAPQAAKTEKFLILPTGGGPRSGRTQRIVIDPQSGKAHMLVAKGQDTHSVPENKPVSAKLIPSASDAAAPGNTVMIITNAQGAQSRIVLTPEHEKILFPNKAQPNVSQIKAITQRVSTNASPVQKIVATTVSPVKAPPRIVPKQQKSAIITSKGQLIIGGRVTTTAQNMAPMPEIRPAAKPENRVPKRIVASEPKKLVQAIQKTTTEPLIFLQQKSGAVMQLTAAQFEHLQRTGQIVHKTAAPPSQPAPQPPENEIVVQKSITMTPKEARTPTPNKQRVRKSATSTSTPPVKKAKREIVIKPSPIAPSVVTPPPLASLSQPMPAATVVPSVSNTISISTSSAYSDLDNLEELLPSTAIVKQQPLEPVRAPAPLPSQPPPVESIGAGLQPEIAPASIGDAQLLAVPGENFGGPPGSFYLCVDDNGTLTPIDNQPLVLENNQLVPMVIEPPPPQDILQAALANSDVFHADAPNDTPDFQNPNAQLSVSSKVSETSTTLNQPIMAPVEVPTKGESEPIVSYSNLEDRLAVIGITPHHTVPTSLELPITVTDPRIAPKTTTDLLSNKNYGTSLLPSPNTEMTYVSAEGSAGGISMPLLTDEEIGGGKSMPILTDDVSDRGASSVESGDCEESGWSRRLLTPHTDLSDTSENSAEIPLQPHLQLSVADLTHHT